MKGAFELSLSFIVVVVIAVVLLGLAITFLTNTFPIFEDLTHKITDIARNELLNRLASQGQRVGIAAPAITTWKRGETGSYALGIRNDDPSSDRVFYINVYLDQLGGALVNTPVASKASEVRSWLTFSSRESLPAGQSVATNIIIKPPTTTSPGIYLLRAVVCETSTCADLDSPSLYGSAQFAIEIVG